MDKPKTIEEITEETCEAIRNIFTNADQSLAEINVPPGYKLVPIEPTESMLDKGEFVNSEWLNDQAPIGQPMYRQPSKAVYKAMLAASPDPQGET